MKEMQQTSPEYGPENEPPQEGYLESETTRDANEATRQEVSEQDSEPTHDPRTDRDVTDSDTAPENAAPD